MEVIDYSRLSQTSFARLIGCTQANLWRQLNGQKVNLVTIMAIAEHFPEIDTNWLLRGNGQMIKDESGQEKRIDNLIDVVSMQQETIRNLQDKIKQLQ